MLCVRWDINRAYKGFNMFKSILFSKLSLILTSLIAIATTSQAQIISPSATEVNYSYTTTFEFPLNTEGFDEEAAQLAASQTDDETRAQYHAQHMFGLLHSPEQMKKYGVYTATEGGIGAPQAQMNIRILSSEVYGDTAVITYSNSGKMILNKIVAKALIKDGSINLPLPKDYFSIYRKDCTDAHYDSLGDYWYFYNAFRSGCQSLKSKKMAVATDIEIKVAAVKKIDQTPKLPYLRGDNGNGSLFSVYVIHGFAESSAKDDEGRGNFDEFDDYMRSQNFAESREKSGTVTPLHVFKKEIVLDNGKKLNVEVKHMLVDTAIEKKSAAFAKFFKKAAETADVILYGGHSGLGGNLDIPSLEEKVGAFKFNPKKKQIFFFESCSSYSYYLQHFAVEKTKAKIDIITNGLTSYFDTSTAQFTTLMDHLLSPSTVDTPWIDILTDMESNLDGDTYLLNVGGV